MTKDSLVQYLRKYVAFKKEYSYLEAREYYLRNTIPKLLKKPDVTYESQDESIIVGVVAFNFVFDLFLAPFIAIFLGIFFNPANILYEKFHWGFADSHPIWTTILCGFTLGFILLTPISVKISKIQKEESIEKIKSHEDDVKKYPKFQQELQELLQKKKTLSLDIEKLEKMNMIYSGYLLYAQTLLTYLETGRADTLKEALNLLEYELREEERDRIQQAHNQEM